MKSFLNHIVSLEHGVVNPRAKDISRAFKSPKRKKLYGAKKVVKIDPRPMVANRDIPKGDQVTFADYSRADKVKPFRTFNEQTYQEYLKSVAKSEERSGFKSRVFDR